MAPAVPFDTLATGSRTGTAVDYRFPIGNNLEFPSEGTSKTFPLDRESILSLFQPLFLSHLADIIAIIKSGNAPIVKIKHRLHMLTH